MAKSVVGVVTSTARQKSIRVEVPRTVRHLKYGKYMRRSTVCHAHDEQQQAAVGDTVELVATRPLSKTKRWNLVRIVARAATAEAVEGNTPVGAAPAEQSGADSGAGIQ